MKRELTIFLTAVMFYTRIPCPSWVDHHPYWITKSTRYFPLVGGIVGSTYVTAMLLLLTVFPEVLSLVLALVVSVLITGAFHEDGFVDMCDGFGGGWTKESIMTIMKDSRIGTYGAIGLILGLSTKLSATHGLWVSQIDTSTFVLLIIASHTLSRSMAVIVIRYQPYAREEGDASKAKPIAEGVDNKDFIIAMVIGFIPMVVLLFRTSGMLMLLIVPMLCITYAMMRYCKKWIGGYTGDCLGAVQQLNEVVFLLGALSLCRFI